MTDYSYNYGTISRSNYTKATSEQKVKNFESVTETEWGNSILWCRVQTVNAMRNSQDYSFA